MSSRFAAVASALMASVAIAVSIDGAPLTDRADASATASGPADAFMIGCSRGKQPSARTAFFGGQMDQVPGGERMRMRFALYERIGTSKRWRAIAVPALRGWHVSDPGVKRFIYRQHVDGLKQATAYRMRVQFQWFDAKGERIANTYDDSAVCRQPGRLANLAFRADIHGRPGSVPGTYGYVARIHNNGRAASPQTQIELRIDGAQVDVKSIGRLRPGERRFIRFVGPACVSEVAGRIDLEDAVREITKRDNAVAAPCSQAILE